MKSRDKAGRSVHLLEDNLADKFQDASTHVSVASIIRHHLVDQKDIRDTALQGLNLSLVKEIVDLGCGFGYFTKGLKGKVPPEAEICGIDLHSRYKEMYFEACVEAGIRGDFCGGGINRIKQLDSNHYDLILCSFALYFFPDYIEEVSRILKEDGIFAVITHSEPHMHEFTSYVKNILRNAGMPLPDRLPYEDLISNFSNENGERLLSPFFSRIRSRDYCNELLFKRGEEQDFEKYFRFKKSFFLPEESGNTEEIFHTILKRIKNDMENSGSLRISKKDIIYICSGPTIK
ncbi:MAG: class I SAM-dependent methyltransferase [Desulfobacula sp.]|nr:class I SAM-dependent methyltransferase [Desulfobacula sp.]